MNKPIRVALLDFDGTLVTKDILDVLCGFVGKGEESRQTNEAFHQGKLPGLASLVKRINFLSGLTQNQIKKVLESNSYLMPGTKELIKFFKENEIITILASGNIIPVLKFYQRFLGIDYIIGSQPQMDGDTIVGIEESVFVGKDFKVDGIKTVLKPYNFNRENIIAIGDSPSDRSKFEMSGFSIAINPRGNIAEFADVIIHDDLKEAVKILEKL